MSRKTGTTTSLKKYRKDLRRQIRANNTREKCRPRKIDAEIYLAVST
jgi:hypothetical protein